MNIYIFILKTSYQNSSSGFVVDTFIRPPVTITINFTQAINLQSILINAKVNAQISNGFTISSSSIHQNNQTSFKQISKFINNLNNDCNVYKFMRRNTLIQENEKKSKSDSQEISYNVAYFNARPQALLDTATAIQISIICTRNSSQPCLRSVEVIGWLVGPSEMNYDNVKRGDNCESLLAVERVVIPNEFLDDLTHELMRMPIRLPSNKTVDKTTLDRYNI